MKRLLHRVAPMVTANPLLAHGPRTHGTGIQVPTARRAPARSRVRRDVDAPRVHLGREHRAA